MKMRKWVAVFAVGLCFGLTATAQEKSTDARESAPAVEAPKTNLFNAPSATAVSKSPWALTGKPRTTLFPGAAPAPAGASKEEDAAPGRLTPRYEIAAGYSYIDFNPGNPFASFENNGATGSFTYNWNEFLGLTAEVGSYAYSRNLNGASTDGGLTTFLFGPRFNWRRFDHFVPFTEFLFGGARAGGAMTGVGS